MNSSRPDGLQYWCRECYHDNYRRRQEAEGKTVRPKIDVPDGHKRCPRCQEIKPHAQWDRSTYQAGGFYAYCKACRSEQGRKRYFQKAYGVEPEFVEEKLAAQDGKCLICRGDLDLATAHLDHDHDSGKIRGLLCFVCNAGIGQFQDDPALLRRAAAYLTSEGETCTPTEGWAGTLTRLRALTLTS